MNEPGNGATPTWQTVKSSLVHRCALAAAGKWLYIRDAAQIDDHGDRAEPHLIAEARRIARRLGTALTAGDEQTVWDLIDSGGPRWTGLYDWEYLALDQSKQEDAVKDLERLATKVASVLLDMAAQDNWKYVLSEVQDPYAFLCARTKQERIAARARMDLLVHRGHRQRPLIVDVKTGQDPPSPEETGRLVVRVASKYGQEAARILDRPVLCRALYLSFGGEHQWSEPLEVMS